MALRTYDNRKAAGSQSVRTPVKNRGPIGVDLSSSRKTMDAAAELVRTQSKNEGVTEYMKWSEEAAKKETELTAKNGSNAIGLQKDFDEWNKEYYNNMEFKDRDSENAFLDRAKIDTMGSHKRLNTYEASEAAEYKVQLDTQEITKGYSDAYVALEAGDDIGYALGKAKADIAAKSLYSGRPDVDTLTKELRSKSLSGIASNKVSSGDASGAARMMERAHGAKDISDMDKLSFDLINKKAVSNDVAGDIVRKTVDNPAIRNYNKKEWAALQGAEIPEEEWLQDSGHRRSNSEIYKLASGQLNDFIYESDEFYVGDKDFNDMVNDNIMKSFDAMSKNEKQANQSEVNKLVAEGKNAAARYMETKSPADKAKYMEVSEALSQLGEFEQVRVLGEHVNGILKTDTGTFIDYDNRIKRVAGTENIIALQREIDITDNLSLEDKKRLTSSLKKTNDANYNNSMNVAENWIKKILELPSDGERWSTEQQNKYYEMKNFVTDELSRVHNDGPLTEENIRNVVNMAIKSNKIGADDKNVKTLKVDGVYDLNNPTVKKTMEEYNLTKQEYKEYVNKVFTSGMTPAQVQDILREELEIEQKLNARKFKANFDALKNVLFDD